MPEVVGTFFSADLREERANGRAEPRDRSLGHLAQECLEFAEGHLDGVKVARVLGQVAKRRADLLDRRTHTCSLVEIDIVHDDDVAAPERRDEALLDIGEEHLRVHGAFDHHRSGHLVVTQSSYKGDRLPLSKWRAPDQFDASWAATIEPHHLGGDGRFIDKHQPGRIKHSLLKHPASTRFCHVGAVLFLCPQILFF